MFTRARAGAGATAPSATVTSVPDDVLAGECLDVLGDSASVFVPVDCALPLLVVFLRDLGRFCSLKLDLVCRGDRAPRSLTASARATAVRLRADGADVPLVLTPGWNYVTLDLRAVCEQAWAAPFEACRGVTLNGSARYGRVFFADAAYANAELPRFLRAVALDDADADADASRGTTPHWART
jgi:hypothetical protein